MRHIILSGYYGFDNAGDEAVLYSIIQALRVTFSDEVQITVLSNKPEETARDYGVLAVNRWDMKTVYRTLKSADLLVSGGGSLLQDVTSSRSVIYYTTVIGMAKFLKKKIVFYGQGVGPLNQGLSRFLVKRAANKSDLIFVRDEASKKLLESIGVKKTPVEVVMDPVVGMQLSEGEWAKGQELINREMKNVSGKKVGFYLRNWKVEGDFTQRFASALNQVIEKGYHPVFIPMHFPSDVDAAKAVAPYLKGPYTLIESHYSAQEILAMTRQLDFVVAMRLHGLIMAANAKTPFMGISYDPKIEAFSKSIGFGQVVDVNPFDEKQFSDGLFAALNDLENLKRSLIEKDKALYDLAIRPAKAVFELLK